MKNILLSFGLLVMLTANSQVSYKDSVQQYLNDYVEKHEVVTGTDKQYFRFFPVTEDFRVVAIFKPTPESKWFTMETSGAVRKTFRTYGILEFSIHDTLIQLPIYQSQGLLNIDEYKNWLFLPFTDLTSGELTYSSGRYIDLQTTDIKDNKVVVDFNKAYNPYCAYVSDKYNCPIPPKENQLPVAITAGEMNFAKPHS